MRFLDFVRKHDESPEWQRLARSWHVVAICDALEQISLGRIPRLMIAAPRGSGKSLLVSRLWPAWHLASRPEQGFISAVASGHEDAAVAVEQISRSAFGSFDPGHERYQCVDVFQEVSGSGAMVMACDDLNCSDRPPGEVRAWVSEQVSQRLDPSGHGLAVVASRTCADDLIGYVRSVGQLGLWQYICIPAMFENSHPDRWAVSERDPRNRDGDFYRRDDDALLGALQDQGWMSVVDWGWQYQQRGAP